MSMFSLIIFVISMDRIGTSNFSQQHHHHHHPLFQSLCQGNDHPLKSSVINFSPTKYSWIIFKTNFSLFYCEHQQTTSYSSSGFSILYSTSNLRLLNIDNSLRISSIHSKNASLFHVNQSSFSSTMMSSNENNLLFDSNSNRTTTTLIHSFLSTSTTTIISNVSLHQPSEQGKNRTWNFTLLIGCISGSLILIIILVYALMKYRNRDEGSYKIDESQNFLSNSPLPKHDSNNDGGKHSSSTHHRQKLLPNQEQNGLDTREWYV